jgi:amino acid transporter
VSGQACVAITNTITIIIIIIIAIIIIIIIFFFIITFFIIYNNICSSECLSCRCSGLRREAELVAGQSSRTALPFAS